VPREFRPIPTIREGIKSIKPKENESIEMKEEGNRSRLPIQKKHLSISKHLAREIARRRGDGQLHILNKSQPLKPIAEKNPNQEKKKPTNPPARI